MEQTHSQMNHRFDITKPMQVGGQAVLEGVMMRAPGMVATAVRRADGTITVRKERYNTLAERNAFFKLPVLRGAVGLVEMLLVGIRALNFSAELALQDADAEGNGKDNKPKGPRQQARERLALAAMVVLALAVGVLVFFVTPLFVTTWLFSIERQPLAFNLVAGAMRVALLLLYLFAIARLHEIQRVFAYHGAEHKAVFAFERGDALTVRNALRHSRFHPRCGTSFLLVVMLVAILLFGVLDALILSWLGWITVWIRLATHLPLIPVVGGISYEFIKASARHADSFIGRLLVAPGLWLQRITTLEPDERQLEVGVVALQAALGEDIQPAPVAEPVVSTISMN